MQARRKPDDLSIPAFLKLTAAERRATWDKNPPKPMPLFEGVKPRRIGDMPEAWQAEIDRLAQRRKDKRLTRHLNTLKRKAASPVDLTGMRWDPRKGQFVPDFDYVPTGVLKSGLVVATPTQPSKPAPDDLPSQIKAHYGADAAKLKVFAKANGCWDDKYGALPNTGLVRMNVVNRLRAKVRKGHEVKWI